MPPSSSSRPKQTRSRKRASQPSFPRSGKATSRHPDDHEVVLDLTGTLFMRLDAEGRIAFCTRAWADILRMGPREITGRSFLDLVVDTQRDACRLALVKTLAGHPSEAIPVQFQPVDGEVRWFHLNPSLNADNNALYIVAHDISAEKRPVDSLPTPESILDEIDEGVVLLDAIRPGYPVEQINVGFSKLTGYSPAEVRNRPLTFATSRPCDTAEIESAMTRALEGERTSAEACYVRKDGAQAWVRIQFRPVRNRNGVVRHLVAVHADVSERRMIFEALREKNRALADALESLQKTKEVIVQRERMHALGKMASGIVHDFNNLLSPILGFTELLLTIPELRNDEEKVITYLKKIRTAATDGSAVVTRLREFYRSRSDREPEIEFSLSEALKETLELTSHRWHNEAQGAGLQIDVVTNLAATAPISGSVSEIRQVLTNLVLNAVDAMPDGGTLNLRTYEVGSWVCVQLADTGTGMSEETRRRCFEPFFTTKGHAGTGLGLAIVFGIVERHHGRVEIDTSAGRGTTFTLWFPASHGDTGRPGKEIVQGNATVTPLHLMIVDDEDLLLEVVSQHMLNMGHQVTCFTDPAQALESFLQERYDFVITDRAMPGMTGDQLAKQLREFRPEVPIVLLTGFADIIRQTGEVVENIDEVLGKPVSQQVLREVVARHGGQIELPKAMGG